MNSSKAEWIFWESYASRYNHFSSLSTKGYRFLIIRIRGKLSLSTELLEIAKDFKKIPDWIPLFCLEIGKNVLLNDDPGEKGVL